MWYVVATTDKLAAGREELRNAIAEFVIKAVENGWVDAGKAEGWLEELEKGRVLMEGGRSTLCGWRVAARLISDIAQPTPTA